MTSNNEKKLLTKSDINKVFWRSFTVNASFNYERQMSQGAQYALSPILQKLYPDKKELGEALQRHAEFFKRFCHLLIAHALPLYLRHYSGHGGGERHTGGL